MPGSLDIRTTLSRSAVPATHYLEQPLYALIELIPQASDTETARAALNIALVVDSSATMHNFQLNQEERDFWQSLAISRDEMERGEADDHSAIYWSGQTLIDMQEAVRKPMTLVVDAIKSLLVSLHPEDRISVIAFADRVHTVFSADEWNSYPAQCRSQLDLLAEQRLPVDIGTGTHMSDALRTAAEALAKEANQQQISRLIILSDGIVQDSDSTLLTVAALQDQGIAIATIGLGDEFDEEFLTRVADRSRGDYHYASDSAEISQCLTAEIATLQSVSVTDTYIAVRGLEGAVVQDMALVRPAMSLFDEIDTEEGWTRAKIGDISSTAPTGLLLELSPAIAPAGKHGIAEIHVTWSEHHGQPQRVAQQTVEVEFSDDPFRLASANPDVADLVGRYHIYKLEREAQRASDRGDIASAQEKLGAATRALRGIGEEGLAVDMEGQIAALAGGASEPSRVKRIKATTRKLGSGSLPDAPTPL